LADRRSDKASEIERRFSAVQAEVATAEAALKRLYTMVENGLTDLDDILKDRITTLKSDRDRAKEALTRITILPS
jgi:site-specific DNA recombinase